MVAAGLDLVLEALIATYYQARSHSAIVSSPPGLAQIHECYRTHFHWLFAHPRGGTFCQGGYSAGSRGDSCHSLGWCDTDSK